MTFSTSHQYLDNQANNAPYTITATVTDDAAPNSMPDLLVSDATGNSILRFNGNSGAFYGTFVASGSSSLSDPDLSSIIGPDGNLYVDGLGSNNVERYNSATGADSPSAGNTSADFIAAGSSSLSGPEGLAFGSDGYLYVTSSGTDSILRFNGSTGAYVSTFVSSATATSIGMKYPNNMHFGPDGNLYVSDFTTATILRFNGITGVACRLPEIVEHFSPPPTTGPLTILMVSPLAPMETSTLRWTTPRTIRAALKCLMGQPGH